MITGSELLAAAHEADLQLKALSDAAEALRQAEVEFRAMQLKLARFTEAASAVLNNKPLRVQLGNVNSLDNAMVYARDTATYIGKVYAHDRLDEFI